MTGLKCNPSGRSYSIFPDRERQRFRALPCRAIPRCIRVVYGVGNHLADHSDFWPVADAAAQCAGFCALAPDDDHGVPGQQVRTASGPGPG